MNCLYNLAISTGASIEKFLVSIEESSPDEMIKVLDTLSNIYGKQMIVTHLMNRSLTTQTSVLTEDYKKDLSFLYKYIFLDKITDKYRIVSFESPNTQLVLSNINLKLVYYGNIKDIREKVIMNYINMTYPLARIDKLYTNESNIEEVLPLVKSTSILLITDDDSINTLSRLVKYNVSILMIDKENYIYEVKKEFNKLIIEKIGW
jgi:hypothetical protein|nr:MAG TPA: hypothetical protein [Caudoviricetes sp.]